MVNPALTILFDVFIIGSALGVLGYMAAEYLQSRQPTVGRRQAPAPRQAIVQRRRASAAPAGSLSPVDARRYGLRSEPRG